MKDECICNQCPRRFVCFTQKKVFSDPAYQAMYEAHVEEGLKHEVAVKKVREFIERHKTDGEHDRLKEQLGEAEEKKIWKKDTWNEINWKKDIWEPASIGDMPICEAEKKLADIKELTKRQYYDEGYKSKM